MERVRGFSRETGELLEEMGPKGQESLSHSRCLRC